MRLLNKQLDATAKSSWRNMLIRPVGMILGIIYTPLLLDYLGVEANGVWTTVLSFITWINYCDLGIGNGLRNRLTKELSLKQYDEAGKTVSTAYAVLTIISLCILGILVCIALLVDWNSLFRTELSVTPMIVITFIYITINFVLALSNSILYALQLSEQVSVRSCLVQVINIIGVLCLQNFEDGNLTHIAILFGTSTSAIYIINTISIVKRYKYLKPRYGSIDYRKIKDITSFGIRFFVIQLTAVLILSSHNLIASKLYGAVAVTPLNTVNTVFAAGYSMIAAFVVPMWSRTTQAISRGEFQWIRNAMGYVRKLALLFAVGFIVVAIFFTDISRLWLGRELSYQPGVIAATCFFYLAELLNLVYMQFYYGMDDVRFYMWFSVGQAVLIIPMTYLFCKILNFGIAGVKISAGVLLSLSGCILPFVTNRRLNSLERVYVSKHTS